MSAPSRTSDQAIKLDPNSTLALNDRGIAYGRQRRSTAPSRITTRPSRSIRANAPSPSTTAGPADTANAASSSARSGLRPGHQCSTQLRPGLQQPRQRLRRQAQEYDRAIRNFGQAIHLDSEYAPSQPSYGRGVANFQKDEYDKAQSDFEQAVKLDPMTPSPSTTAAPPTPEARTTAPITISTGRSKLDPNNARAFTNRGLVPCEHTTTTEPSATTTRPSTLDPKNALAFYKPRYRLRRKARVRPRHPGSRPGDQARPE